MAAIATLRLVSPSAKHLFGNLQELASVSCLLPYSEWALSTRREYLSARELLFCTRVRYKGRTGRLESVSGRASECLGEQRKGSRV